MKLKKLGMLILSVGMIATSFTTTFGASNTSNINAAGGSKVSFSDTANHWAAESIQRWSGYGVMKGADGKFRPNDPITRGELAVIFDNLMDYEDAAQNTFADLDQAYYTDAILKAAKAGVILGDKDKVRPKDLITRQEAAVMIGRGFGVEPIEGTVTTKYKDAGAIASWASREVYRLEAKGYMVGNEGRFNPTAEITRGEIVKILDNMTPEFSDLFNHEYIKTLEGGFEQTLEEYAKEQGLSSADFYALIQKPAAQMSINELEKVNAIREKQIKPDEKTLMQKVITTEDMKNYLNGKYQTPRGFVSVCADVKAYQTLEEIYQGLRLDYEGTSFKPDAKSYAMIRFYSPNVASEIIVPKSSGNGGTYKDPFPFGGAGFTTGTKAVAGSPEWVLSGNATIKQGAQILEIYEDGSEVLRGIYSQEAGRFLCINNGLELSK